MKDALRKPGVLIVLAAIIVAVAALVYLLASKSGRQSGVTADGEAQPLPGGKSSARVLDPPVENPQQASPFHFTLMTPQSGIDFRYYGSPSPQAYMIEQNGGGVSLLDFDNDKRLDIFLVNGSHFQKPATGLKKSNRIFRATADFRYEDVTEQAGLPSHGFGMGSVAADYDNDGFTDLFVAYYGRNRLWKNNGDGTFTEVTELAGVGDERWGTSAAFADLDGDGLLDLYVVNYVEWSSDEPPCQFFDEYPELKISCTPGTHLGQADLLYRNLGNGRFQDVSLEAGIALVKEGKGLALAIADLDVDGRLDIYVANDTTRNFLFRNLGAMRFEEVGIVQGVAFSSDGLAAAGMGVACADYDRNGRFDLCVSNFRNQLNDVFANVGSAGFVATNTQLGVDLVSRPAFSFGTVLADFDLDGWPDMFVTNGHIWDLTSLGKQFEYQMQPYLLHNRGGKRFADVTANSGDYLREHWLGRAAAVGDLDNDGDVDIVVTDMIAPPALLRNDSPAAGKSLCIELIGTRSSRQPLGARVEVVLDETVLAVHVPAGGSFQASHDQRLLVPTGNAATVDEIRVWWPGGDVEIWHDVPVENDTVSLVEGTGQRSRSTTHP